MSYNLFLDDYRDPNKFLQDTRHWKTVRNYNEFVRLIETKGMPRFISFDHDLSWEHYPDNNRQSGSVVLEYDKYEEKTGYDCAKWLIEYCMRTQQDLPEYQVHSMNPIGKINIKSILANYKKNVEEVDDD